MDKKYIPNEFFKKSWYWEYTTANVYRTQDQIEYNKRKAIAEDAKYKKAILALLKAPNPKIVQVDETNEYQTSLHYEVAIVFDSTTLSKAETKYNNFNPKLHSCSIYRWNYGVKIRDEIVSKRDPKLKVSYPKIILKYPNGAYLPWLAHKRSKPTSWSKAHQDIQSGECGFNFRIISAHLFFKTEQDFANWMGEYYSGMFTDLL